MLILLRSTSLPSALPWMFLVWQKWRQAMTSETLLRILWNVSAGVVAGKLPNSFEKVITKENSGNVTRSVKSLLSADVDVRWLVACTRSCTDRVTVHVTLSHSGELYRRSWQSGHANITLRWTSSEKPAKRSIGWLWWSCKTCNLHL